ncbi:MAG: hypothetical protein CMK07_04990 [Ponticaulis sp.]|nr:hypothetical protein [Ponticaulis sp.]
MTNFFRVDVAASIFAIIAGILHLGAYWGLWWSPPDTGTELHWRVGISVAAIVVGTIIVASISAAMNRNAPATDERESRVQFKAMRNMLFMYSGGLAILFMEAFGDVSSPMALAHAVIGIFIVAELVRLPSLWWYLREPG